MKLIAKPVEIVPPTTPKSAEVVQPEVVVQPPPQPAIAKDPPASLQVVDSPPKAKTGPIKTTLALIMQKKPRKPSVKVSRNKEKFDRVIMYANGGLALIEKMDLKELTDLMSHDQRGLEGPLKDIDDIVRRWKLIKRQLIGTP